MKLGSGDGLPGARDEPYSFRWRSSDAWRPKRFRHDQARPIGARDPIAAFPFPAEARSTEERSQGPLSDQGPETVRRGAVPSAEANTNLTNDPWMTTGVGTFGNSGACARYANGAEGPMPLQGDRNPAEPTRHLR